MKLTTITSVSVDGVMKGLGGPDEDRRGGLERGGMGLPLFDNEAATFLNQVYQRADAFLFGRLAPPPRNASLDPFGIANAWRLGGARAKVSGFGA